MSDVATKVKAIIIDKLGVDEAEVTDSASFTNDLGADSLDTVELIMEFEKEFDIQILYNSKSKLLASVITRQVSTGFMMIIRFKDYEFYD